MKSNLLTILFASFVLLFGYDLQAQGPDGPCDLPTYNVSHNIDDGIVVFDIYQALLNDQIINLASQPGFCEVGISIEENYCFYSQSSYNEEYIADGNCGIDSWELLLTDTEEDCCGSHIIPYYITLDGAEGTLTYCSGLIYVDIECLSLIHI